MLKKILSAGLFLAAPALFAQELTSFDEINNALHSAQHVSAVVYSKRCKISDPNEFKFPISDALVRLDSALMLEDKIGFDAVKYARAIPTIAPNGLIQRVSLILGKDGNLNGIIASFDAVTHVKPLTRKDITIDCKLGDGVRFYQQ